MSFEKYVGRTVEMIYQDNAGKITQRQVVIRAVNTGTIQAFCLAAGAPRTFRADNVLAVQPVKRGRSA